MDSIAQDVIIGRVTPTTIELDPIYEIDHPSLNDHQTVHIEPGSSKTPENLREPKGKEQRNATTPMREEDALPGQTDSEVVGIHHSNPDDKEASCEEPPAMENKADPAYNNPEPEPDNQTNQWPPASPEFLSVTGLVEDAIIKETPIPIITNDPMDRIVENSAKNEITTVNHDRHRFLPQPSFTKRSDPEPMDSLITSVEPVKFEEEWEQILWDYYDTRNPNRQELDSETANRLLRGSGSSKPNPSSTLEPMSNVQNFTTTPLVDERAYYSANQPESTEEPQTDYEGDDEIKGIQSLECEINGSKCRGILDLGSKRTFVSLSTARRLKLLCRPIKAPKLSGLAPANIGRPKYETQMYLRFVIAHQSFGTPTPALVVKNMAQDVIIGQTTAFVAKSDMTHLTNHPPPTDRAEANAVEINPTVFPLEADIPPYCFMIKPMLDCGKPYHKWKEKPPNADSYGLGKSRIWREDQDLPASTNSTNFYYPLK